MCLANQVTRSSIQISFQCVSLISLNSSLGQSAHEESSRTLQYNCLGLSKKSLLCFESRLVEYCVSCTEILSKFVDL